MSELQLYRDSDRPASNRCYSVQISRRNQIQQLYKHTLWWKSSTWSVCKMHATRGVQYYFCQLTRKKKLKK